MKRKEGGSNGQEVSRPPRQTDLGAETRKGYVAQGTRQVSGVSKGRLRDYEKGKRKPTFKKGVRLASALGVSCDALAGVVVKKPKTTEQIANSNESGIQSDPVR